MLLLCGVSQKNRRDNNKKTRTFAFLGEGTRMRKSLGQRNENNNKSLRSRFVCVLSLMVLNFYLLRINQSRVSMLPASLQSKNVVFYIYPQPFCVLLSQKDPHSSADTKDTHGGLPWSVFSLFFFFEFWFCV